MTGFIVGMVIGGIAGMFVMCLAVKSKESDVCMEQIWDNRKTEQVQEEACIRFTDVEGQLLFLIPDGGKLQLLHGTGESMVRVCKYLDDGHFRINNKIWQTQEFAEEMEKRGISYYPLIKRE